jgi:hypothetical protein
VVQEVQEKRAAPKKAWRTRALSLVFIAATLQSRPATIPEIPSLFFISKTENRNQVHFSARVDAACGPVGPAPVQAYWRMLERGPLVTEPLLPREERAYGIARQTVEGGVIRLTLRAIPTRPIVVRTWRAPDGKCLSASSTVIAGFNARLFNVHVVLKWFGVEHLVLTGWKDDGSVVREIVVP